MSVVKAGTTVPIVSWRRLKIINPHAPVVNTPEYDLCLPSDNVQHDLQRRKLTSNLPRNAPNTH